MEEDRVAQLLRRANELDDLAVATKDPSGRSQLKEVADTYRKMAAQEIRLRDAPYAKPISK